MSEFESSLLGTDRLKRENLEPYGFLPVADGHQYEKDLCANAFRLIVFIDEGGNMETRLIDKETGDDYNLYKLPSAHGEYLTAIRDEVKGVIRDIKAHCYEGGIPLGKEFIAVRDYFHEKYGEDLEYLWGDDETCIIRRHDNGKWYACFMRIPLTKLGLSEEKKAYVAGIRGDPSKVDMRLYFPGYHSNKKSWICMVMDERSPVEELILAFESSRDIAGKKGKK